MRPYIAVSPLHMRPFGSPRKSSAPTLTLLQVVATPAPIDVHYQVEGPHGAPVLVLSHALGLSLAMWDPQMVRLSRVLRVVRYDHRGHGGSAVPAGPYRIEDLGR